MILRIRITCKNCLGFIFLTNLLSVSTETNVFGTIFVNISSWGVPYHPETVWFHKSPANQSMKPTQTPIYWGFGVLLWIHNGWGGVYKPDCVRDMDRPLFRDDKEGQLFRQRISKWLHAEIGSCQDLLHGPFSEIRGPRQSKPQEERVQLKGV